MAPLPFFNANEYRFLAVYYLQELRRMRKRDVPFLLST